MIPEDKPREHEITITGGIAFVNDEAIAKHTTRKSGE